MPFLKCLELLKKEEQHPPTFRHLEFLSMSRGSHLNVVKNSPQALEWLSWKIEESLFPSFYVLK